MYKDKDIDADIDIDVDIDIWHDLDVSENGVLPEKRSFIFIGYMLIFSNRFKDIFPSSGKPKHCQNKIKQLWVQFYSQNASHDLSTTKLKMYTYI